MEEYTHRRMYRILSFLSVTHIINILYLESQQLTTLRMHVKCRAVFYFAQYCDYVSVKYLTEM